jgi:ParB/RepB/Spo0J family partition protein
MSKKKQAGAVDGAETAGNLAAAWPFPSIKPPQSEDGIADDKSSGADKAERIHASQINLYTDPARNVTHLIALEQLIESPTNPRTSFDTQALAKMAESIRSVGVMQQILVRPVDYAQIQRNGQPVQAYEIVFGHRRYRASKLAGVETIPCFVRELTDSQAAQLQSIENVQREDLNPMEAARSYQQYLQAHSVTKDQLAQEIGLSRSHVYGYLTLLKAVPMIQDAVRAGDIGPDVAIKIARLHTPKLQERALAALKGKYYDLEDGGKKSVRQITEFLAEKFTLNLKEALFDPKDAKLLEGADACTACPKRTGNAPEYQDLTEERANAYRQKQRGEANLCTDPDCFDAKKKAHLAIEAGKLAAKGKTVIEGAKARQVVGADGTIKGGYIALKEVKSLLAKQKGAKPAALPTVVVQNPRDGTTKEAVKIEDLKAAGVKVKDQPKQSGGGRYDYQAEARQREEERAVKEAKAADETRVNTAILAAVREAAAGVPLSPLALQLAVAAAVSGVEWDSRGVLAQLHDCKSIEQLQKKIGQMPVERLTTLLLDCALVVHVKANPYRADKPEALLAAAKHYGVDVAEIRKAVTSKPADTKTGDLLQGADSAAEQEDEEEAAA